MKKLLPIILFLAAVVLPACCVFNGVRHPEGKATAAQDIIGKTTALVHFIDQVGVDEDGDAIMGEVDPINNPDAKMRAYCAAVWVSDEVMVTAHHCIEDIGRPPMRPIDIILNMLTGKPLPNWNPVGQKVLYSITGDVKDGRTKVRTARDAVIIADDPKHDIALLRAKAEVGLSVPKHPVAPLANDVEAGEEVRIMGHPKGMWWTYAQGVVSAQRTATFNIADGELDVVQISAPVWFGNSGGGAFNASGELVGICSRLDDKMPNTSYFISIIYVRELLEHERVIPVKR